MLFIARRSTVSLVGCKLFVATLAVICGVASCSIETDTSDHPEPIGRAEQMSAINSGSIGTSLDCNEEVINGITMWVCYDELPVGPGGGSGGGTAQGLCGFLELNGDFEGYGLAHISVNANNRYVVITGVEDKANEDIRWATICSQWYNDSPEFLGIPDDDELYGAEHYEIVGSDSDELLAAGVGEEGHLCTWAGFYGDVLKSMGPTEYMYVGTALDDDDGWRIDAVSNNPDVVDFRSYVWCHGWYPDWHRWEYYASGHTWDPNYVDDYPVNDTTPDWVGAEDVFFCWLTGLGLDGGPMEATIDSAYNSVNMRDEWRIGTSANTHAGFECVDYDQQQ